MNSYTISLSFQPEPNLFWINMQYEVCAHIFLLVLFITIFSWLYTCTNSVDSCLNNYPSRHYMMTDVNITIMAYLRTIWVKCRFTLTTSFHLHNDIVFNWSTMLTLLSIQYGFSVMDTRYQLLDSVYKRDLRMIVFPMQNYK